MKKRIPFFAGNWKMNKGPSETERFIRELATAIVGDEAVFGAVKANEIEIGVFPPFVSLERAKSAIESANALISLGAQNMHWEDSGAFTGEVSGTMIKETGCKYVILGHSERRHIFGETDDMIEMKMRKAIALGIKPVLCVGETLEERDKGMTESVVEGQLKEAFKALGTPQSFEIGIVIAYEPVWAIGTGRKASDEDAQRVCAFIRSFLESNFGSHVAQAVRILYGGSVKPDNAMGLMSQQDIDGALIGGASLDVSSFIGIIKNGMASNA